MTFDELAIGPLRMPAGPPRPSDVSGAVVLVRGPGRCRLCCEFVADVLRSQGLATLSVDLPVEGGCAGDAGEAPSRALAAHWTEVIDRLRADAGLAQRAIGLFGAGPTAASTLRLAAERPAHLAAAVACEGRLDADAPWWPRVLVPTLLIVGAHDDAVLAAHRGAMRRLRCSKRLETVPQAGRLFEQPGALDAAAHLAADWLCRHLRDGDRL